MKHTIKTICPQKLTPAGADGFVYRASSCPTSRNTNDCRYASDGGARPYVMHTHSLRTSSAELLGRVNSALSLIDSQRSLVAECDEPRYCAAGTDCKKSSRRSIDRWLIHNNGRLGTLKPGTIAPRRRCGLPLLFWTPPHGWRRRRGGGVAGAV